MKSKIKINEGAGFTEYLFNGQRHRDDGPALISFDGTRERWYLYGKWIASTREYCASVEMTDEETVVMILKYGESLINERCEGDYSEYEFMEEITREIDREIIDTILEEARKHNKP